MGCDASGQPGLPRPPHRAARGPSARCGGGCVDAGRTPTEVTSTTTPPTNGTASRPRSGSAATDGVSRGPCPGLLAAAGSTAATNARRNISLPSLGKPQPSSVTADSSVWTGIASQCEAPTIRGTEPVEHRSCPACLSCHT